MESTVELSEGHTARIEADLPPGETPGEFVRELLNRYESEGNLLWEGYGGEP